MNVVNVIQTFIFGWTFYFNVWRLFDYIKGLNKKIFKCVNVSLYFYGKHLYRNIKIEAFPKLID